MKTLFNAGLEEGEGKSALRGITPDMLNALSALCEGVLFAELELPALAAPAPCDTPWCNGSVAPILDTVLGWEVALSFEPICTDSAYSGVSWRLALLSSWVRCPAEEWCLQ